MNIPSCCLIIWVLLAMNVSTKFPSREFMLEFAVRFMSESLLPLLSFTIYSTDCSDNFNFKLQETPKLQCDEVPKVECLDISVQKCSEVPVKTCQNKPKIICTVVSKEVPKDLFDRKCTTQEKNVCYPITKQVIS